MTKDNQLSGPSRLKWFLLILIILSILSILWRWSPLAEMLDIDSVVAWAEPVRVSPLAPLIIIVCFMIGGLLVFPVTVMIAATALIFDPFQGFINSLLGSLASALLLYLAGALVGRNVLRRIAGVKINNVSKALAKRGIITITTLRIIPVAPFSIINLVAGASHIRLRDYTIGTILGMTPGIITITLFTSSLRDFIYNPNLKNILIISGIIVVLIILLLLIKKYFQGMKNGIL